MKIKRSFSLDLSLPVLVLIGISAWAWGLEATATFVAWGLFLFLALATLVLGFVLSAGKNVQVAVAFGRFVAATPRVEIPSLQAHPVVRAARFTALLAFLASLAYLGLRGQPLLLLALLPFLLEILPLPKLLWDEYLSEVLRRAGALAAGVALFALSLLALLGVRGLEMMAGVYTVFYLSLVLYLFRWLRSTEGDAVDS